MPGNTPLTPRGGPPRSSARARRAPDHAPASHAGHDELLDHQRDAPHAVGQRSVAGVDWPAGRWTLPVDEAAAERFAVDIRALWLEEGLPPEMLASPGASSLLACVGGSSPYLADLALRSPVDFARLLENGPDRFVEEALEALSALSCTTPREDLAHALRVAKGRVALGAALADIGGFWSLESVTLALSRLAEAALDASVNHLLRAAHEAGRLSLKNPDQPARGSGYVVLAMGKLGARELNFSSDIDLVALFDADLHADPDTARQTFIRITSDLVRLMEARDADGYVFRTDLRLRPDPSATPLAVSLPAAIAYYESLGQTWERAAMTKARPVAGNIPLGRDFLRAIHPFVWRRNLDFALIDDIHDMKSKIDRHRKPGRAGLARLPDATLTDPEAGAQWLLGHNVKLGEGGIREIEFVTQAMQLVWGGKTPGLRERRTLQALRGLTRSGHLPADEAATLSRAYRLLREVEHRIQMRADQQTHDIPANREGFEALAIFLGYASGGDLALDLLPQMRAARRIFERHFTTPTRGPRASASLSDLSAEDLPERLAAAGFPEADCETAAALLRHWVGNSRRALQSERAHSLLRALAPSLLTSFIARRNPLACLRHFDTLLSRQRAGVQLLSLLERNPALIARIAAIFDASPFLADHLADTPSALEGLLEPEDMSGGEAAAPARIRSLADERPPLDLLIGRLRPVVRAEEFRLSVARLEGRLDEDRTARDRTAMADAVIAVLLDAVLREHRLRHGRVPGGGAALVALGKAGSREMMSGSDLDLMLVFDHPEESAHSVVAAGKAGRAVTASQYYLRLAHSFVGALTAPDAEGPLYAVDMRLRPSGAAGPVAVSLTAFRRYHEDAAWTWERMALTRARVVAVAGEDGARATLRRSMQDAFAAALGRSGAGRNDVLADAAAMRARLERDRPSSGPCDVKLRTGGLMEVDFIAQALQLVADSAEARSPVTATALQRLGRAGVLGREDARFLVSADQFWRTLQGALRLLCGPKPPHGALESLPPATLQALLRAMGESDVARLVTRMEDVALAVRAAFVRLVGPVGEM
ncbi:bifunctional [glutamine synthetase] adenylyltransferase/[glutamine synthetase]-adenylyl-L-tyrosine phosphorylase [Acetobacter sacchari]|uniref:Bifunctional [glutamine synthetase] adenylyltransferase/[glutamine synthetase]-adenylyl-L-tyrosine phosphorylase n=1 Tax=Acetobacter sacchari TaxID=2661687 RepID=A0ABS3LTG4_9PROT|nr:bifunctional [glutamine synthetase] adenylyltransferase/[glutamine synthetase]-adenylyl-L-tyrosine phosphorylase [Acetobacter sacchari]MBO1359199.1 bifunctional [glutamine synthetase] adenylyltransferase/[glutamine synthetase]-adenylyl-L-tyrosine phosphorylase [Acetobacter sacchari]